MTVPPNMLASIGIAFGAWFTARTGHRAPFIIGSAVVTIFGMTRYSFFFLCSNPSQVIYHSPRDKDTYVIFMATG